VANDERDAKARAAAVESIDCSKNKRRVVGFMRGSR